MGSAPPPAEQRADRLGELVASRRTIVCCGSGGVGKTTTAAALAVEGARRGRRAVVVTIDPAKRLADALGLDSLPNTPARVEGDWPGELWALMLDTKSTFDALVARYAPDERQVTAILGNRFYRNISGALSGTQEYMAAEKLYELHQGDRFDLVVVDTPPTRSALDFLDAPRRLTRFLDNRVFRLLMMPTRAYLKVVSVATQAFLRTISRVVGAEVVSDVVAFFQAFEGMEEGFRQRAEHVAALLADTGTAFVLVAAPRREAIEEASYFAERLSLSGLHVSALVMNRMHPRFGGGPATVPDPEPPGALLGLYANLAAFRRMADAELAQVAGLAQRVEPAPVVSVPFMASDVHDLHGLAQVGRHLVS